VAAGTGDLQAAEGIVAEAFARAWAAWATGSRHPWTAIFVRPKLDQDVSYPLELGYTFVLSRPPGMNGRVVFTFRPSAIPPRVGLEIDTGLMQPYGPNSLNAIDGYLTVVRARCANS